MAAVSPKWIGRRIPCPSFKEAEDGSSRFAISVRLVLEATCACDSHFM